MSGSPLDIVKKYEELQSKAIEHYRAIERRYPLIYRYTPDGWGYQLLVNIADGIRGPASQEVFNFGLNLYQFQCSGLQDLDKLCNFFHTSLIELENNVERQEDKNFLHDFYPELLTLQKMTNRYCPTSNAFLVDINLVFSYFVSIFIKENANFQILADACEDAIEFHSYWFPDSDNKNSIEINFLDLFQVINEFDYFFPCSDKKELLNHFKYFLGCKTISKYIPLIRMLRTELQEAEYKINFTRDLAYAQCKKNWAGMWYAPDSEAQRAHRLSFANTLDTIRTRNLISINEPIEKATQCTALLY